MSPSLSLVVLSVREDWLLVNHPSSPQGAQVKGFMLKKNQKKKHRFSMFNIQLVPVVRCPLCRRYQDSEVVLRNRSDFSLTTNQFGLRVLFSCFNPWRLESLHLTTRYFYMHPFTISWHTCFAQENGLTANSDYRIGSQIMENTWSFKTITFEESAIFIIKIDVIKQGVI